MKMNRKRTEKTKQDLKARRRYTHIERCFYLALLFWLEVALASGKISRVEGIHLNVGIPNQGVPKNRGKGSLYAGSLHQVAKEEQESAKDTKIQFDFKLTQQGKGDSLFNKAYRIKLEIDVDLTKVKKQGLYEERLSREDKERFNISLYENYQSYWGLEPKKEIKNLSVRNLEFKLEINSDAKVLNESVLTHLILDIITPKSDKNTNNKTSLQLQFNSTQNLKRTYQGLWSWYYLLTPWLLPLTFLYSLLYPAFIFLSCLNVKLIEKTQIQIDTQERFESIMYGYENFGSFYKTHIIALLSISHLYSSVFSLVLLAILLAAEFGSGFLSYVIACNVCKLLKNDSYTSYGIAVLLFLEIAQRYDSKKILARKKNSFGLVLILIIAVFALVDPVVIYHSHWIMVAGAVYSSVFTNYENPSLVDFLTWVDFFGSAILFNFVYIHCYRAIRSHSLFLEPFFSTWFCSLRIFVDNLLLSLSLLALLLLIDFLLLKTKFFQKKFPKNSELPKIGKNEAKGVPGVINFVSNEAKGAPSVINFIDKEKLKFGNLTYSGTYILNKFQSPNTRMSYKRLLEKISKSPVSVLYSKKQSLSRQNFVIQKVLFQGKKIGHFVAFLREEYESDGDTVIELFDLRVKKICRRVRYKEDGRRMISRFSARSIPDTILIRKDFTFLVFSRGEERFRTKSWNAYFETHHFRGREFGTRRVRNVRIQELKELKSSEKFKRTNRSQKHKNSLINFNKNGDKAIVVLVSLYDTNLPCRWNSSTRERKFVQEVSILEIKDPYPKPCRVAQTFVECKILNDYYPNSMVNWAEFLTDSNICLVFNNQLLILQTSGRSLRRFFRIQLFPKLVDFVVFWGEYQKKLLFCKFSNERKEMIHPKRVYLLEKDEILRRIVEIEGKEGGEEYANSRLLVSGKKEVGSMSEEDFESSFETSKCD